MKPTVSVLLATHARPPELVLRAIQSILSQTDKDLELLIGIDGPDLSCAGVLSDIQDARLLLFPFHFHRGQFPVIRNLLEFARGSLVLGFSDDDIMDPQMVSEMVGVRRERMTVVVTCDRYDDWLGERKRHAPCEDAFETTMISRSALDLVESQYGSIFPPELRRIADVVLLHRLRELRIPFIHIHEPLMTKTIHAGAITRRPSFALNFEGIEANRLMGRPIRARDVTRNFAWTALRLSGLRRDATQ